MVFGGLECSGPRSGRPIQANDFSLKRLAARSEAGKRIIQDLAIVGTYPDGSAAMDGYKDLHRREPGRELYVVHTDREALDIGELY